MKRHFPVIPCIIAAGLLTACGNNADEAGNETSVQTESQTEESTSETETSSESDTENSSESENTETESSSGEENAENPLKPLADAALAVGEWPHMEEVTDEAVISDYFLLDADNSNYKNLMVMQCPMSANMSELIIIEAEDTETASEDLDARLKKAQDTDAFYPDDVEKAKNAIVGTAGGYAYYILSSEPEKSEEALLMQIEG